MFQLEKTVSIKYLILSMLVVSIGYLLVCDFGIAKRLLDSGEATSTLCGTPEYLAPEMLTADSYNMMVDWWALGILIYEMMVGIPPFYHHKQHRMFKNIKSKKKNIKWPDLESMGITISDTAKDIVEKLLCKDPRIRLGAQGDVDEILAHPWFADLNKDDIMSKRLTSPYVPSVKSDKEYIDASLKSQVEAEMSVMPPESVEMIR